jgi:hypothetical protein
MMTGEEKVRPPPLPAISSCAFTHVGHVNAAKLYGVTNQFDTLHRLIDCGETASAAL